jgi:hypothetical protein
VGGWLRSGVQRCSWLTEPVEIRPRPWAFLPWERQDRIDQQDRADISEPTLTADPTESTEATDPAEPIDRMDPADPIDRIEPVDPIDRIDPLDPMLSSEPAEPPRRDESPLVPIEPCSQALRSSVTATASEKEVPAGRAVRRH